MAENFSWIRRLSQIGTLICVPLFGKQVGEDSLGNRYYQSRKGPSRRWVLYRGAPEATMVPPEWFLWIHHMACAPLPVQSDQPLPNTSSCRYAWQKPHVPNLTGTTAAPVASGYGLNVLIKGKQAQTTPCCRVWDPSTDTKLGD